MKRGVLQKVKADVLASCPLHFPVYFLHPGMAAFSIAFVTQIAKDEVDGDNP